MTLRFAPPWTVRVYPPSLHRVFRVKSSIKRQAIETTRQEIHLANSGLRGLELTRCIRAGELSFAVGLIVFVSLYRIRKCSFFL